MKTFHENNDDNLNKNSNNIEDINNTSNDTDYNYDSTPIDYNYDYSYTEENLNETKDTHEIVYPKSKLDKIFGNPQVIKEKKSNKKSITLFFIIAALIFSFGIYKITSKDTSPNIVDAFPVGINDFSTDSKTIGTLPDGRNLHLYELPIEALYNSQYKNTINFLDMYDRKVLFEIDTIEDPSFKENTVYAYDLDTGELKIILDSPTHQAIFLISDEYILCDTLDNIYLYNIKTESGEYLLPLNPHRELKTSFTYNTILVKDTIFYIYKNTLESYHVPTKKTVTLNLPPNADNFNFLEQNDEYFLIGPRNDTDTSEKSFLINKDNPTEIITIPYEGEVTKIIDTENALIFSTTRSNQDIIDLSFNKETKEFTILEEDFFPSDFYFHKYHSYDDLAFHIAASTPEEFSLKVYSTKSEELTSIDLNTYIKPNKFMNAAIPKLKKRYLFSRSDYTRYTCTPDYVLIKDKFEDDITKVYLILAK